MTCGDIAVDKTNVTITQSTHEEDSKGHSHSEESDNCSPFCSCQCCQITVDIFPFHAYTLIPEKNILELISSYNNTISQEVLESLYHPPIV